MTVHTLFVVLNYLSVVVMAACCVLVATHAESRMQKLAFITGLSLLVCCIGFLFRIEAKSADAFIAGQKLAYAFVTQGMFVMLLFILEYCRFSIPRVLEWVFHTINILLAVAVLTLDHHDLFYKSYWAVDMGGYCILEKEYGPLHTVAVALFVLYMAAAVVAAVVFSVRNIRQRREYVLELLVAVLLPCTAYIIPKLTDINNDLQPTAFAAFMVLVLLMIYQNGLYDVQNIAAKYDLNSMKEAVIVFDSSARFKGCNAQAQALFPILETLCLDCSIPEELSILQQFLEGKATELQQEDNIYEASVQPITQNGRVYGQVIRLEDVTIQRRYTDLLELQKQRLESQVMTLEDLSYRDQLTGLANRRSFEEAIAALRATPDKDDLVLAAFDLNGLKGINDTVGHIAGDELVQGAAQVIAQALEPWGLAYRTGGDEFYGILTRPLGQTEELTRRLEEGMAQWKGKMVSSLSFSYGLVRKKDYPDAGMDELMILADKQMYLSKREYYTKNGHDRRKG